MNLIPSWCLALVRPRSSFHTSSQRGLAWAGCLFVSITFFGHAKGSEPLHYQSEWNGSILSGASNDTLTGLEVQPSPPGQYPVPLNNAAGNPVGESATLIVSNVDGPQITVQPRTAATFTGGRALISVAATGTGTITYQWLKNGVSVVGATSPTLEFAAAQSTDAGAYQVLVSDENSSVNSVVATLTVAPAHTFTLGSPGTVAGIGGPTVPAGLNDVVSIAAGSLHALALRSNGTVVEWGHPPIPPEPNPPATRVPPGLSNVVAVAASKDYSLALRRDGTVVSWGGPEVPPGIFGIIAISAGANHGVALRVDGRVLTWGSISDPPEDLHDVIAISANRLLSIVIALRSDGSAVVFGQAIPLIGMNPNIFVDRNDLVAVAAGYLHVIGLRNDGTVLDYFHGSTPVNTPAGLSNVTAIAAYGHSLALQNDGSVVGWNGASLPANLDHVTAIAAGEGFTVVLSTFPVITEQPQDLTVDEMESASFHIAAAGQDPLSFQWQKDGVPITGATNLDFHLASVQGLDAGDYRIVVSNGAGAVTSIVATLTVNTSPVVVSQPGAQTVFVGARVVFTARAIGGLPLSFQWRQDGMDLPGQISQTLELESVQVSDAGDYSVLVSNSFGVASSDDATLTVTAHVFPSPTPGTVVSLNGPMVPLGLTDALAVAAGSSHSLAVRSDGTVVEWGYPLPPHTDTRVPPDLTNVVAIVAGFQQSLALRRDGTVVGWGDPGGVVPPNLFGVVAIAAGPFHSLALKADGTVVSWGLSPPPPADLHDVIAVAAGGFALFPRSIALRSDGSAVIWGGDTLIDPNVFTSRNDLVAVAAGANHVMGLVNDGTVLDYFRGSPPTNAAPAGLSDVVAITAGPNQGLALKSDGTVVGWNGPDLPEDLHDVSMLSAGSSHTLLITVQPPRPVLAAAVADGHFTLLTPISVSGFVVETIQSLTQPTAPGGVSGSIITFGDAPPTVSVATNGTAFYRMRLVE